MIVCDYCNTKLACGKACVACSKIFCEKCSTSSFCSFCENELVDLSIRQQKFMNSNIQWISSGKRKFGLFAFNEIPIVAFKIFEMPIPLGTNYDLILFPSKKLSRRFATRLAKKSSEDTMILGALKDKPPDSSRYTIIMDPKQKKPYVLLNTAATRESALVFLIRFFDGLFGHSRELSLKNDKVMAHIAGAILKSLREYNSKFGINFFIADDYVKLFAYNLLAKLWWSYTEHLTLKEFSKDHSLSADISRYVSRKVSIIFDLTKDTKFYTLADLINLAGVHADALNIVYSTFENPSLFRVAINRFEKENESIRERLSEESDINMALEVFVKNMKDKEIYANYETFTKAVCENLTVFLSSVEPKYVWLEEMHFLCVICDDYQRQVENHLEPWNPQFGGIDNFLKLLFNIFQKIDDHPHMYPEPSAIAGYIILQLLEYLAEWKREYLHYFGKAVRVGCKLAVVLEKGIPEIKRKNPDSPFRYSDIALIFTGLGRLSLKCGAQDKMTMLFNKARTIARKYSLLEIEYLLDWHEFVLSQDYDKLLRVYKMYSIIATKDLLKLEPQFKTVAALSAGIFEKETKFDHYKEAIASSFDLTSDISISHKTSILHDLIESRVIYYIANLFLHIEEARMKESINLMKSALNKAKVCANALEKETGLPTDPMYVFILKTRIITDLLSRNVKDARHHLRELAKFAIKSKTTGYFLEMAKSWCEATESNSWKGLLDTMDLPFESRDPWSSLLVKIADLQSKESIKQKLELISKSILFVEGPTEEAMIPVIAKRLGLDLDKEELSIIALRGSSKGKYHLKFWKEIVGNRPITLFMLLDLDAKEQAKEAIKNGLIIKDNCFVLSQGCIEDYYPIEVLIEVIEDLCGKKPSKKDLAGNRVLAIDSFLKKNRYTEDWKITIAKKVADKISQKQVHPEITMILKRIKSKLRQNLI